MLNYSIKRHIIIICLILNSVIDFLKKIINTYIMNVVAFLLRNNFTEHNAIITRRQENKNFNNEINFNKQMMLFVLFVIRNQSRQNDSLYTTEQSSIFKLVLLNYL